MVSPGTPRYQFSNNSNSLITHLFFLFDYNRKLAKDEVFQSLSQCISFLKDISSAKPLTGHKLTRLQLLIKENGILSIPNARFASKVFAALLEWVLGVFSVSCCKSVVHHAKSSQMVKVLASRGDLVADVCDEVKID